MTQMTQPRMCSMRARIETNIRYVICVMAQTRAAVAITPTAFYRR